MEEKIVIPESTEEVISIPSHKRPVTLIVAGFLVLLIIGLFYFIQTNNTKKELQNSLASSVDTIVPDALQIPEEYKKMTVPSLREREYKSTLGEREQLAAYSSYTQYLTSYDSDGLKINALLTIPTGEKPEKGWPAVVFVHGYIPPTEYRTTEKYVGYVDYLARNGFVVLKIDLRGHGESEGEAGGGYYGSDYIVDTLNARAALQSADFVNPGAIGLWGHSMGGNVLLRSIAARPEIPGIVIWAGAVYTYEDQREYGISDNSYRPPQVTTTAQNKRRLLFEKVGTPSATSKFWQQVAPTNYLNDLKGAIEIHHAVNDDVVNIGYSRDLIALLDKTQVPHELFEYPTGGHNIDGPSFTTAMQRTVEFYKKYLVAN